MNNVSHFLENVQFTPVNNDGFTLFYERNPSESWSNDIGATNLVQLPSEQYEQLRTHIDTYGIQKAMRYNIMIGNKNFQFISDLTEGLSFTDTTPDIRIERFKSKDDLKTNIDSLTFELLWQEGYLTEADRVKIPYVIVPENVEEKLFQCLIMMYFVADQFAQSIKTTSQLVADLISASTPSANAGGPVVNVGLIIRYALQILLETAKLVALAIALTKLAQQFIELILPRLRYFYGMTVQTLLTKALSYPGIGLTYNSALTNIFKRVTLLPVPIDYKNKKWWDLFSTEDDRILNRGYPTSSDTTPTLGELISELEKMYNLRPVVRGGILNLQPKGTFLTQTPTYIQNNKTDQEGLEDRFDVDCSEMWKTKIISYTNDFSDKMLYDNPRGLRVQYTAYSNDSSEWTRIRGIQDIRINFALGTIKKETKIEKEIKKVAKALDSFLGTNLINKVKKRDGVLALSQSQFEVTKILYQIGGKQTNDYVQQIGAGALWTNYHYMDVPSNLCFRVYNNMPIAMNTDLFDAVFSDDLIKLETDEQVDIINCEYVPEDSTANVTYRKKDSKFAKHIKVKKVYED